MIVETITGKQGLGLRRGQNFKTPKENHPPSAFVKEPNIEISKILKREGN